MGDGGHAALGRPVVVLCASLEAAKGAPRLHTRFEECAARRLIRVRIAVARARRSALPLVHVWCDLDRVAGRVAAHAALVMG